MKLVNNTDNFMAPIHKVLLAFFLIAASCSASRAQLNLPSASPDNQFTQQIGFTDVTVKYSRPSARGRQIFGGLVPFGEIWRTGAHDATTIQFSDSVLVSGNKVPAGTYTLFTVPSPQNWTVIINKATEMHGTSDYEREKDHVRFYAAAEKANRFYETFTIEVNDLDKEEASLYLIWENTQVKLNIRTYADARVMAEINDRINIKKEERPSLFYQSSLYYFNNGKDLEQAYAWIQIANGKAQDASYLQLQAKIEAKQGNHKSAIATLNKSTELAKTKKLDQIILTNEKLMTEWSNQFKK
jgi:hypothetical protein